MQMSGKAADALEAALTTRRRQIVFRLMAAGLIMACYVVPVGWKAVCPWGCTYFMLQLIEFRLFWTSKPVLSPDTRLGYYVGLTFLFLNSTVFGSFTVISITRLGVWGFVCAANILAGSMLNTVLTTIDDKDGFRASMTPFFFYALITAGALLFYKAEPGVVLGVAFGFILLMLSAFKLWRQASRSRADQRASQLALEKAVKAATAANESKSSFLATVSHEIRTPMNGIAGILHLLKEDTLSADGLRLLEEAIACSGVLGQLINDVLDLSKIEAGKLELAPAPTDVAEALRGVVDLVAPLARGKGLYLTVSIDAELVPVLVDPVRLRQCLFNLIGNAVKFTLKGGVDVRLIASGNDRLRIEVQDTGIGIPVQAMTRLFQRFEQADATATRNFGGSGLGLAISRNLAQMMGGDIGCDSEEGVGSTFWFEIAAVQAPIVTPPLKETSGSLEGMRVLLVDDNATNRLVGSKILEIFGAEVFTEEDGQSGVAAARTAHFDLVLMDINMPGMDGLEAIRRIRASRSPICDVPIVALTANVMAHQREAYIHAGVDGVVAKPFSPTSLMNEIAQVFQALEERRQASGAQAAVG